MFLEGGSDEEKTICEKIAEMRPRLTRMHKFRSLECEDFLADPLAMEPPELGPGEFNAELDAKYIAIAFDKYGRDGQAKTAAMGDLMRDLGADWDAEEEKEALRALDPLSRTRCSQLRWRGRLTKYPHRHLCCSLNRSGATQRSSIAFLDKR